MAQEKIVIFHHDERGAVRTWSEVCELIRCKNCDNYSEYTFNGQIHGVGFCDEWDGFTKETGFCHKANKTEN